MRIWLRWISLEINQAAKIWVNGRLVKEIGAVSDSKEGYVYEEASTNIKALPDKDGTIEIIIQVSNYSSAYGGITFARNRIPHTD